MTAMTIVANSHTSLDHRHAYLVGFDQVRRVLTEARPAVLVVFLLRLVAATGILWRFTVSGSAAVAGWLMLVLAVYVFNGVTDVQTDRANGSSRPIASGQLKRSTALRWCMGASSSGLALCWLVGPFVFCLGAVLLVAGWAYSDGPSLKNAPVGFGMLVGVGAALTYAAGWLAGGVGDLGNLVVMLGVSVWVGACCASKDFSDIAGDRLGGRRTWPVLLGAERAAKVLAIVAIACGACVLTGSVLGGVSPLPAALIVSGSIVLAGVTLASASAQDRTVRRRPYRVFMATQYATNLALIACSFG
jgi:4-hydroxybenzoate polyprenyltransferase